jgi:hypothetical protein
VLCTRPILVEIESTPHLQKLDKGHKPHPRVADKDPAEAKRYSSPLHEFVSDKTHTLKHHGMPLQRNAFHEDQASI